MKFILSAVLLVCVVASALGGDCDIKGHKVKAGEKYAPLGECIEYTCDKSGSFSALTCAVSKAGPSCKKIPQDLTKPYPRCCEQYVC